MRFVVVMIAVLTLAPVLASPQTQAPSLPLGTGRPDVEGIKRTVLKDDAKVTVTRVVFEPNAAEPPHTHPTDVILVPVVAGSVEFALAETRITSLKAGEVQFVPRRVVHSVKNTGKQPFELIAITIK